VGDPLVLYLADDLDARAGAELLRRSNLEKDDA
jgi:hypothetical protein